MYHARPRRRTQVLSGAIIVLLLGFVVGATAISVDAFGAGDRFDALVARVDRLIAGPPPDRPIVETKIIEEGPSTSPSPTPDPTATPTLEPGATPAPTPASTPTPAPTPRPDRTRLDFDIVKQPKAFFKSQLKDTWCAPAGVQMTLAVLGLGEMTDAFQRRLQDQVKGWESIKDSRDGLWGPSAMALALRDYGAPGYEVRAYRTREGALRDAARAIMTTEAPVILLAWRGAHTWVMTGFRSDADPTVFSDATVSGAYVLDPWYPRVSSIWGPSDPAGTFQDAAELERNYLRWQRPEGNYPDRDGLFISVVPTIPASEL